MVTCAIDLGKFKSVCCFFDPDTQKHQFETIATKRSHIENLLTSRTDINLVVMEACGPSGWINDIREEKGKQITDTPVQPKVASGLMPS